MNLKIKKILAVILIVIIIGILSLGLYLYYNKSNNNDNNSTKEDNKNDTSYKISNVYEVNLNGENQVFTLNEKNVSLKLLNKELYVNDNKISSIKVEKTYVTNQVIIFTYMGNCNQVISYVIDADGKSVPFTKNNYQVYDFRMVDDKFVVAGSDVCPCKTENNCNEIIDISLTYNGKELIIK